MFMPILRNMAHAQSGTLADRCGGYIFSAHLHLACAQRFKTRNPVNKLRLTVAVYARNADDLAGTNIEADVFDRKMFMHLDSTQTPSAERTISFGFASSL